MFDHPQFEKYDFLSVPAGRDLFLMDEKWMVEYEHAAIAMFNGGEYANVGYISYAAVRDVNASAMELSWYPSLSHRFHELDIVLPRDAFVACVDCPNWDTKPYIFVTGHWQTSLHLRAYSVFAIVDAIGGKLRFSTTAGADQS